MSLWSRVVNAVRGDRLIREIEEELECSTKGMARDQSPWIR